MEGMSAPCSRAVGFQKEFLVNLEIMMRKISRFTKFQHTYIGIYTYMACCNFHALVIDLYKISTLGNRIVSATFFKYRRPGTHLVGEFRTFNDGVGEFMYILNPVIRFFAEDQSAQVLSHGCGSSHQGAMENTQSMIIRSSNKSKGAPREIMKY